MIVYDSKILIRHNRKSMKSSKIHEFKDSGIYILFRIKEMCKCQRKKLEESKVFVSEKEQGEEN